ncbi:MAG TPA: ScpA family protein [Acidimicrobiales bacterium]|nr:ScpA family protein [Acidimicrobiales bacterium]
MGYQVSTPVFEGPFDLLLHLVTREQVDIWDLSISSIVDQYVAALAQMEQLDLAVATEFLLIAAVLLELKARRMLPSRQEAETEEELAIWEERDLLLARLVECKTFKDASSAILALMTDAELSLPRQAGLEERFAGLAPDPLVGVSADDLKVAMLRVLAPKPMPKVSLAHVATVRVSVAETLDRLSRRLPLEGPTTFRRLTTGLQERLEVIVYFLALLELFKRGAVDLSQTGKLAELHVRWLGADAGDATSDEAGPVIDLEASDLTVVPQGPGPRERSNAMAGAPGPRQGTAPDGPEGVDEYDG